MTYVGEGVSFLGRRGSLRPPATEGTAMVSRTRVSTVWLQLLSPQHNLTEEVALINQWVNKSRSARARSHSPILRQRLEGALPQRDTGRPQFSSSLSSVWYAICNMQCRPRFSKPLFSVKTAKPIQ